MLAIVNMDRCGIDGMPESSVIRPDRIVLPCGPRIIVYSEIITQTSTHCPDARSNLFPSWLITLLIGIKPVAVEGTSPVGMSYLPLYWLFATRPNSIMG